MRHLWIIQRLSCLLCVWFFTMNATAQEPTVILGDGFKPNQIDSTYQITFKSPRQYVEVPELAQKYGFYKYYQMPAPDGRPRSFFTVAFQAKSQAPGLRNLTEFVNADLNEFKAKFPQAIIAKVNVQGIIAQKFGRLEFPMEMFSLKGNKEPGSYAGDSLVLFFATPGGFWSIVWTVAAQFIQQGFPVFFEPFIQEMVAEAKGNSPSAVRIYLLPMEGISPELALSVAKDIESRHKLKTKVTTTMGKDPSMFNAERQQYTANEIAKEADQIVKRIKRPDEQPFILVLTPYDINAREFNLRFLFAAHLKGISVVSTARIDPVNYGQPRDDKLRDDRLLKLINKAIGQQILGYPISSDRKSVMYGPIMGLDDLDAIGREY